MIKLWAVSEVFSLESRCTRQKASSGNLIEMAAADSVAGGLSVFLDGCLQPLTNRGGWSDGPSLRVGDGLDCRRT